MVDLRGQVLRIYPHLVFERRTSNEIVKDLVAHGLLCRKRSWLHSDRLSKWWVEGGCVRVALSAMVEIRYAFDFGAEQVALSTHAARPRRQARL